MGRRAAWDTWWGTQKTERITINFLGNGEPVKVPEQKSDLSRPLLLEDLSVVCGVEGSDEGWKSSSRATRTLLVRSGEDLS